MAHATRLLRRDATRLPRREPNVQLRTDPELQIRPQLKLPDWLLFASWSFRGLFSSFPTIVFSIRWRARERVTSGPDRSNGVLSYPASPCPAAPPCAAPTRRARSVFGFWIRQVDLHRISLVRASGETFWRLVYDAFKDTKEACFRGEQFCWHPVLPEPAPPLRRAPRPDPPVVCSGFGIDRFASRTCLFGLWFRRCVIFQVRRRLRSITRFSGVGTHSNLLTMQSIRMGLKFDGFPQRFISGTRCVFFSLAADWRTDALLSL